MLITERRMLAILRHGYAGESMSIRLVMRRLTVQKNIAVFSSSLSSLTRPFSPVGCQRWGCMEKRSPSLSAFYAFHYLWYITSSLIQILFDIVYPSFFCLPWLLILDTKVSNAFAGNLELSVRFTCPNHCSLRLCIFYTSVAI